MKTQEYLSKYKEHPQLKKVIKAIENKEGEITLKGLAGSSKTSVISSAFGIHKGLHLVIIPEKEYSAYICNDLENLFEEREQDFNKKKVLYYPCSYKVPYETDNVENANILLRTEALSRIQASSKMTILVTHPEALCEKVITKSFLSNNTLKLKKGEKVDIDFVSDVLIEYQFERVDFVIEPGQFAIRGGIIDVYSYSNDYPYRIEFFGDEIESIRSFDPEQQLSVEKLNHINIVPNLHSRIEQEKRQSILDYLPPSSVIWVENMDLTSDLMDKEFEKAQKQYEHLSEEVKHLPPEELFCNGNEFKSKLDRHQLITINDPSTKIDNNAIQFNTQAQPVFNKKFDMILEDLKELRKDQYDVFFLSENINQIDRFKSIITDIQQKDNIQEEITEDLFEGFNCPLHEGFIDKELKLVCYTDHQIFERYQRFHLRNRFKSKESLTIKELYDLKQGDYVTHIDHGIGRFEGLSKIENNGNIQEVIRLTYKNDDIVYVPIHSLHRISKFVGKDGKEPTLNKLGSQAWSKLKQKTKSRVKDIARQLIKLYAKRKASEGFQYSPDSYLQNELEASFIYEDTPDQNKSTQAVKEDMEKPYPMDRLICGDVGFGKTEIAIRAAFKAVTDGKQVAILVPTTILALQHYKSFKERLKDFPVDIDYINRFKSAKQQKETIRNTKEGKVDILIGTHRLVGKDIEFMDLGLLIIDEEQKFGVAVKEKLKNFKVNVDTLTLTATPIPRTLQFSLMGARDLSIINTPPPNRYPVETQVRAFSGETIRDAILYEVSRGGQVFFVHNRVNNIMDVNAMIQKFAPGVRIGVAHGQMDGPKLEKVMMGFIEGQFDVLLATKIIESGLDISNANTIIINEAQHFGLSELHQMRGRVGRSNKKAFCYLLSPPTSTLTTDARKRMKAIEEFSDLGSGFNIAMRDLDIRGAGNILGGEQSGFISDIGFEMYHKILDEAILELKEDEFKDTFKDDKESKAFVKDCIIETDLQLMIPDEYLDNVRERLSLYKELDSIQDETTLQAFITRLEDRFGALPQPTVALIEAIRLRWVAKSLGIEKINMKFGKMICWFVANKESAFYESPVFGRVLTFVQTQIRTCKMQEKNDKLYMSFENVKNVSKALKLLEGI
ncbi:MAG: transcription-repair coupling factor [Hyphomicrobiales bacterium]